MSATRNSNSAGPVSPPPDTTPAGKAAAPQNTVVEGTAAYKQPKLKPPKINGRAIKFDSKGPPKWGQQVHPPGQQAQYDDLIDDGIDQGRVIELMTMPERFETDGFGQRLSAAGVLPKRQAKEGAAKVPYQHLKLVSDTNWALFDAAVGFPLCFPNPPPMIERFARYEPDNRRILQWNVVSQSVRLELTPEILLGKRVEYTDGGPRMVDLETGQGVNLISVTTEKPAPVTGKRKRAPGVEGAEGGAGEKETETGPKRRKMPSPACDLTGGHATTATGTERGDAPGKAAASKKRKQPPVEALEGGDGVGLEVEAAESSTAAKRRKLAPEPALEGGEGVVPFAESAQPVETGETSTKCRAAPKGASREPAAAQPTRTSTRVKKPSLAALEAAESAKAAKGTEVVGRYKPATRVKSEPVLVEGKGRPPKRERERPKKAKVPATVVNSGGEIGR